MDASWVLAIAIMAMVPISLLWLFLSLRTRVHMRHRFGPEYERLLTQIGDERRAAEILKKREQRVRSYRLRSLSTQQQAEFLVAWRIIQERYKEAPALAVMDADRLVIEVLEAHGYPPTDFHQRAADMSVDHPRVVENYRAGRFLAERSRRGDASTEDLRKAMAHYRVLFEDLLGKEPPSTPSLSIDQAG